MDKPAPAYRALALQVATEAVNGLDVEGTRAAIDAAIDRIARSVRGALAWVGADCRLVVLPEYVLTGFPLGESVPEWADKAALAPGGREYERLGAIAAEHAIHLAVNAYETDEHFPGLYFQACVVIGPSGDIVLRYRRLHSMFSPSPCDVLDRYLEHHGWDGLFPVADTPIGRLAAVASEEILYPELVRTLGLRGAEVLVHPTSEITSPDLTPKAIARRARALETLTYVVSCNSGGLRGVALGPDSTNGGSEIIDFQGRALVRAGAGESVVAAAEIDLAALRRERRRPGMSNLPARFKADLWAEELTRHDVDRRNTFLDAVPDRTAFGRRQAEVIERLLATGVIR